MVMPRPLSVLLTGAFVLASAFTAAPALSAQQPLLVNMNRFSPHQTRVDVFTIPTPQNVQIEAVGADERFPRQGKLNVLEKAFGSFSSNNSDRDAWRGNAWIIDAATRRVMWELRTSRTGHESDGLRDFKGAVHLPPGTYEAYYASYSAFNTFVNVNTDRMSAEQVKAHTKYDDDGISKKFAFTVRGSGRALPASTYLADVDNLRRSAFISLTGLRPEQTRAAGFALDRPTQIDLYAIGEVRETETFDYGWIINADTHEKVWGLQFNNSRAAGGSSKNREAHAILTLPAGRYAAIYTLDDSHDISDWNSAPPHDPGLWGMTLRVANAADRSHVKLFNYDPKPANPIVAITGVGNSELKSAGFTLKKPMRVRVLALGEGTAQQMDDYGWITNAKTHQKVWSMQYGNSQFAGGGSKNRVASQVLTLDAGSYVVNYRTDDSHSPGDWNSGAPIEGDLWGITLMPVTQADRSFVTAYDPASADGDVIAKLTNMEDEEDARQTFHLDRPTEVRVYAIGEGRDNMMFDRGFIVERGSKRVVWDMKYDSTLPAGGASKNRMFDGVVRLPAGDYVLRWVSDDSHSSQDWNDAPPEDPSHWGITIYKGGK